MTARFDNMKVSIKQNFAIVQRKHLLQKTNTDSSTPLLLHGPCYKMVDSRSRAHNQPNSFHVLDI